MIKVTVTIDGQKAQAESYFCSKRTDPDQKTKMAAALAGVCIGRLEKQAADKAAGDHRE